MTCTPEDIACRLDEIADAVREPIWTDIATVWVAAAAALGTVAIAGFNAWLLWKQHVVSRKAMASEQLAKRSTFGVALRLAAVNDLLRALSGKPGLGKNWGKRAKAALDRAAETGEPSAEALRQYVSSRTYADRHEIAVGDNDAFEASMKHLDEVIDAWVESPSSDLVERFENARNSENPLAGM